MSIQSKDPLIELLRNLDNISNCLNETLKEEQAVLKLTDNQQLTTLSTTKKALVSSLEAQTKSIHVLLKNNRINKGLYGLSDFIEQLNPGEGKQTLTELWASIQALSEDNKKLNDINGSIIELNRRYTQRSLDVLRGQIGVSNSTYGSDGQAMTSKVSRNLSIV
jgi:flagella synthesis protein FlgN